MIAPLAWSLRQTTASWVGCPPAWKSGWTPTPKGLCQFRFTKNTWDTGAARSSFRSGYDLSYLQAAVVNEFTITQIRTPEELDLACRFLRRIFPSQEAARRLACARLAGQSPMMVAARREQEFAGVALGHVDGGGLGTVDQLGVAAVVRGTGLGRRLLATLESGARSLGVRQLTLGSVGEAVGFYQRCGYQGRLLLQFAPPARRDEIAPLFAGFALLETQWQDVPQLWVQTHGIDFALADRVKGRDGVHAQWVMDKNLTPDETRPLAPS
jgi:GNAT superfamily N-acetyltransferase